MARRILAFLFVGLMVFTGAVAEGDGEWLIEVKLHHPKLSMKIGGINQNFDGQDMTARFALALDGSDGENPKATAAFKMDSEDEALQAGAAYYFDDLYTAAALLRGDEITAETGRNWGYFNYLSWGYGGDTDARAWIEYIESLYEPAREPLTEEEINQKFHELLADLPAQISDEEIQWRGEPSAAVKTEYAWDAATVRKFINDFMDALYADLDWRNAGLISPSALGELKMTVWDVSDVAGRASIEMPIVFGLFSYRMAADVQWWDEEGQSVLEGSAVLTPDAQDTLSSPSTYDTPIELTLRMTTRPMAEIEDGMEMKIDAQVKSSYFETGLGNEYRDIVDVSMSIRSRAVEHGQGLDFDIQFGDKSSNFQLKGWTEESDQRMAFEFAGNAGGESMPEMQLFMSMDMQAVQGDGITNAKGPVVLDVNAGTEQLQFDGELEVGVKKDVAGHMLDVNRLHFKQGTGIMESPLYMDYLISQIAEEVYLYYINANTSSLNFEAYLR